MGEMMDVKKIKNKLQLYGNIERLQVLNKRIKTYSQKENVNINDVVNDIVIYHETLERIIDVFEGSIFPIDIEDDNNDAE